MDTGMDSSFKARLFPYFEYSTTKLQRYSIKVLDTAEKAKVLAK